MTVFAVEGVAGSGKTCRLIEVLAQTTAAAPLEATHRVLGLTFMHGARRRLEERLRQSPDIRGRFECVTIDSFGWRLRRRWRSLVKTLGMPEPDEADFDAQCDIAGALLEQPEVRTWVAARFPIIVVDEAQDLKPQRLRMIRTMINDATLLIAADEFQCLDGSLRPNPLSAWLPTVCQPEALNLVRRTNVPALLAAAGAIRAGVAPVTNREFKIVSTPSAQMAAAYLANAIAWGGGGSVAVITPSVQGGFAQDVIGRVCAGPCGQMGNGPYPIRWERSDREQTAQLKDALVLTDPCSLKDVVLALGALPRCGPVRQTEAWLRHQGRALGRTQFSRAEVEANLTRQVELRRHRMADDGHGLLAMTVQQAKNREFDGAVVIWPYRVGGDAEHKRRLLYNAVTRAQRWCTVLVQGAALPQGAPFT